MTPSAAVPEEALTERELQLLELSGTEHSKKSAARCLELSLGTVSGAYNTFPKIEVHLRVLVSCEREVGH